MSSMICFMCSHRMQWILENVDTDHPSSSRYKLTIRGNVATCPCSSLKPWMVHMLVFLAKKPFKPVKQLDSVIVLVSVFLKGIVQSGLFFFFFWWFDYPYFLYILPCVCSRDVMWHQNAFRNVKCVNKEIFFPKSWLKSTISVQKKILIFFWPYYTALLCTHLESRFTQNKIR